jgi:hypothetical protein
MFAISARFVVRPRIGLLTFLLCARAVAAPGDGPLFEYGVTFSYQGETARVWAHPKTPMLGPRPLVIFLHGSNRAPADPYPALDERFPSPDDPGKSYMHHMGKLAQKMIDGGLVTPLVIAAPTNLTPDMGGFGYPWDKLDLKTFVEAVVQTVGKSGVRIDLDQVAVVAHSAGGGMPGRGLNKIADEHGMFGGHALKVFGVADTEVKGTSAIWSKGLAGNSKTAIYAVYKMGGGWSPNIDYANSAFGLGMGATNKMASGFVGHESEADMAEPACDNGGATPLRMTIKVNVAKLNDYQKLWEATGGYKTNGANFHQDMVPMWCWLALPRFYPANASASSSAGPSGPTAPPGRAQSFSDAAVLNAVEGVAVVAMTRAYLARRTSLTRLLSSLQSALGNAAGVIVPADVRDAILRGPSAASAQAFAQRLRTACKRVHDPARERTPARFFERVGGCVAGAARDLAPAVVPHSGGTGGDTGPSGQHHTIPPRPARAMTGSQFLKSVEAFDKEGDYQGLAKRDDAALRELLTGNIPSFVRSFVEVKLSAKGHTGSVFVSPDYLAIGSDADFVRMPLTPLAAQKILDRYGCTFLTSKLSDDVWAQAKVKLRPISQADWYSGQPGWTMMTNAFIAEHQKRIEQALAGKPRELTATVKKDIILSILLKKPSKGQTGRWGEFGEEGVIIYGFHDQSGNSIQPESDAHENTYMDYSHGVRLVSQEMIVDGKPMKLADVLKDKELAPLLLKPLHVMDWKFPPPARYPDKRCCSK